MRCRTPALPVVSHGRGGIQGLVHRPVELLHHPLHAGGCTRRTPGSSTGPQGLGLERGWGGTPPNQSIHPFIPQSIHPSIIFLFPFHEKKNPWHSVCHIGGSTDIICTWNLWLFGIKIISQQPRDNQFVSKSSKSIFFKKKKKSHDALQPTGGK